MRLRLLLCLTVLVVMSGSMMNTAEASKTVVGVCCDCELMNASTYFFENDCGSSTNADICAKVTSIQHSSGFKGAVQIITDAVHSANNPVLLVTTQCARQAVAAASSSILLPYVIMDLGDGHGNTFEDNSSSTDDCVNEAEVPVLVYQYFEVGSIYGHTAMALSELGHVALIHSIEKSRREEELLFGFLKGAQEYCPMCTVDLLPPASKLFLQNESAVSALLANSSMRNHSGVLVVLNNWASISSSAFGGTIIRISENASNSGVLSYHDNSSRMEALAQWFSDGTVLPQLTAMRDGKPLRWKRTVMNVTNEGLSVVRCSSCLTEQAKNAFVSSSAVPFAEPVDTALCSAIPSNMTMCSMTNHFGTPLDLSQMNVSVTSGMLSDRAFAWFVNHGRQLFMFDFDTGFVTTMASMNCIDKLEEISDWHDFTLNLIGEHLYAFGGQIAFSSVRPTTCSAFLKVRASPPFDIELFHPSSEPGPRRYHAAAAAGKVLYVFGGQDNFWVLSDLWKYDTESGNWASLGKSPTSRSSSTLIPATGSIWSANPSVFVLGGVLGSPVTTVDIFAVNVLSWGSTVTPLTAVRDQIFCAVPLGSADTNTHVLAATNTSLWVFDLDAVVWTKIDGPEPPHSDSYCASIRRSKQNYMTCENPQYLHHVLIAPSSSSTKDMVVVAMVDPDCASIQKGYSSDGLRCEQCETLSYSNQGLCTTCKNPPSSADPVALGNYVKSCVDEGPEFDLWKVIVIIIASVILGIIVFVIVMQCCACMHDDQDLANAPKSTPLTLCLVEIVGASVFWRTRPNEFSNFMQRYTLDLSYSIAKRKAYFVRIYGEARFFVTQAPSDAIAIFETLTNRMKTTGTDKFHGAKLDLRFSVHYASPQITYDDLSGYNYSGDDVLIALSLMKMTERATISLSIAAFNALTSELQLPLSAVVEANSPLSHRIILWSRVIPHRYSGPLPLDQLDRFYACSLLDAPRRVAEDEDQLRQDNYNNSCEMAVDSIMSESSFDQPHFLNQDARERAHLYGIVMHIIRGLLQPLREKERQETTKLFVSRMSLPENDRGKKKGDASQAAMKQIADRVLQGVDSINRLTRRIHMCFEGRMNHDELVAEDAPNMRQVL